MRQSLSLFSILKKKISIYNIIRHILNPEFYERR